ncbi:MAG: helix-turn-helix domain-containing protein [Thermomicrobiales bacterium]
MNKPDTTTPLRPVAPRRGTVVYPQASAAYRSIDAYAPDEALAPFVEYFWVVRWDLAEPRVSQTIPQPRIHLTIEGSRVLVYGIDRKPFKRTISGTGVVLGVAFRPAGFRAFVDCSLKTLQDRVVPASSLFGVPFEPPAFIRPDDADLVDFAQALLLAQQPEVDPDAIWCHDLVQRADDDRSITQVRQLAEIAGVSERSLQRRFNDYVGATPKWVIQRGRIMSLVADCNEGGSIDWATAATDLGFADQAHLIRVFRAIVGVTPDLYLRRIQQSQSG